MLGPVKPHFDETPPAWVVDGKFYDRPSYPTGFVIDWRKGRTGNTLLKRDVFDGEDTPFRPEFLTGEDQDFFRRMIGKGHVFVWCHEALAYEVVPPIRWRRTFMLKRALLRGAISLVHPTAGASPWRSRPSRYPLYLLRPAVGGGSRPGAVHDLPGALCDHLGRLLAAVGINPIGAVRHRVTHMQQSIGASLVGPDDLILVTGAGGFIGARLVERLLERGFTRVRCLRRPSSDDAELKFNGRTHARGGGLQGNLLSRGGLCGGRQGRRGHLSPGRGPRREVAIPDAFMNSVVTTRNLLDASLAAGTAAAIREHQLVCGVHRTRQAAARTAR